MLLDQPENRWRVWQVVEHEPDLGIDPRQVQQPVAGNVDQRLDRRDPVDDFEDFRDIDEGWPQQFLTQRAAQLRHRLIDRQPAQLKQRPARQGEAVAVNAVAANADDQIVGLQVAADDDPVERYRPDRGADQVEAAHHLGQLRDLAAGNGDARLPCPLSEADRDTVQHRLIRLVDGDVIDHRYWPRADAQEIVHVHGHAVDADRVVFAHHLRDDR